MKKRKKFSEHRPGCQHWHWSIFCLPSFHVDVSKHNGLFGGSNKMQLVSDLSQMFSAAQDSLWLGKVLAGKSCLSSPFCLFLQASIFPFFFFFSSSVPHAAISHSSSEAEKWSSLQDKSFAASSMPHEEWIWMLFVARTGMISRSRLDQRHHRVTGGL